MISITVTNLMGADQLEYQWYLDSLPAGLQCSDCGPLCQKNDLQMNLCLECVYLYSIEYRNSNNYYAWTVILKE